MKLKTFKVFIIDRGLWASVLVMTIIGMSK